MKHHMSSSEAPKKRTCTSSSSSSTVRVRMSTGYDYPFLRLNDHYRGLRDDLFRAMPQNPHYQPLQNYSAGVCENIKVGLDAVFINLAKKMVKLSSPLELSSSGVYEEFIATLTQLEEMGYDCEKLWRKFDSLRAISIEGEGVGLKMEETISKRRNKQVEATMTRTRIYEVEAELKKLKAFLETEEEIETLKFTDRSPIEEREQILRNFRSAATAPW